MCRYKTGCFAAESYYHSTDFYSWTYSYNWRKKSSISISTDLFLVAVCCNAKSGEITQEEYDRWRYRYPKFDTTQRWAKVPSQALSDMLVDAFTKGETENE